MPLRRTAIILLLLLLVAVACTSGRGPSVKDRRNLLLPDVVATCRPADAVVAAYGIVSGLVGSQVVAVEEWSTSSAGVAD